MERRLILLLFATLPIITVSGYDCQLIDWSYQNTRCPSGLNEIYMQEVWSQYRRLCCVRGSEGETKALRSAPNCRATQCVSSTGDSLCTSPNLPDRYIKGRKLSYEEVMREPCTRGTDGGQGVVGLCCRPNSQEGVLVSTLGAEHNEFPHQARLPGCGGTIYNKRFIITASHCIVDGGSGSVNSVKDMYIFLGTNIGEMTKDAKEYAYKVKRIIPHEDYNRLASNPKNELSWPPEKLRYYNDIALLELEKDIRWTENVKALEIAPENFDPFLYADNAVIVGWGTTETLAPAIHLQKANFILRRDEPCFNYWSDTAEYKDSILCVGGVMNGTYSWTAGGGDSGGPAICRKADGNPVLCGVTSFGGDDDNCEKNTNAINCPPSAYTEVSYFRDWIKRHAGEQDPSKFYQPYLYGKEVPVSQYPHQVRITDSDAEGKIIKSCGGTLVRPDVVVTAAQCVMQTSSTTPRENLEVSTQVDDVRGKPRKTFQVTNAQLLKGFEMEETTRNHNTKAKFYSDNYFKNDLVVIKLDRSTGVPQRSLPTLPGFEDNFYNGTELAYPRDTTLSGKLRSREFTILDGAECRKRLGRISGHTGRSITLDNNLMCGVEKYSGGSTCDRDLGGGLICKGAGNKDVLCGVQTFRLCMLSIPNGFMDMRQYGQWVKDVIDIMTPKKG